jgi:hypothetical protein
MRVSFIKHHEFAFCDNINEHIFGFAENKQSAPHKSFSIAVLELPLLYSGAA